MSEDILRKIQEVTQAKSSKLVNTSYIIDTPLEFEPDERGLGYLYFKYMKKYKNKIAQYIANTGEEDTFGEYLQRSVRTALELRNRNLNKNDVVCLCTYNHKNSSVPFIACLFLGVRVASLDPILSLVDTTHLINEVKPKIFFIVPEALNLIETSLEKTGVHAEIVVFGKSDKYTEFSEFLQPNEEEENFIPEPTENLQETAVILFSSGSTGMPKGIMINHYGLICQSVNILQYGNIGTVVITYASLYWISSVLVYTATVFAGAARVICKRFDPKELWHLIEKYKINFYFAAPNQIIDMIKAGRPDGLDTTSFSNCAIGGATLPEKFTRLIRDLLPGTFVSMIYGQSEVAGAITMFQINQVKHALSLHYKPESVGLPLPGFACKVVDPETEELCGPNKNGELRVKSDFVMNGYYGRDSSESYDSDGWLKTGDIVYYDEEHCFFIVDRIKEMLKYKSWHVAPAMVEKLLLDHPAVQKVVVFGIPHEEDGDHPSAVIILKNDYKSKVTSEDIENFIAERAPDRMRLRGGIKFVETIPLTPSGKVKRNDLRNMVLQGLI